jgi:hypothetical protein
LYDVLNIDPVPGTATVNASGFNVTCGYVVDVAGLQSSDLNVWMTADNELVIPATRKQDHSVWNGGMSHQFVEPGMISKEWRMLFPSFVIFYSTIPIVDSSFKTGPMVNLNPPMNTSISSIQIFQCSLSLVNQTATVDAQSRQLQALGPDFKKTASIWAPYVSPLNNVTTNGNSFIDEVHDSLPFSCFADCASGGYGTVTCPALTFSFFLDLL